MNPKESVIRQSIVQDPSQAASWHRLGVLKEELGDPRSAAYCYFLACDAGRHPASLERLQKLGYLDIR